VLMPLVAVLAPDCDIGHGGVLERAGAAGYRGLAVAAAALAVMPLLSVLKRRTATRLGSQMLVADARRS
jgi:divalent metal cation (Fe/Co/Zn/Cd) transporter